MTRDHQHNHEPNENTAKIVGESRASQPDAANDLEAAWALVGLWIEKVDDRGMTLLRAAFEAGGEARRRS